MEADYPVIIRGYYCYLDHCTIHRPVIQPLLIIAESIDISRDKSIQTKRERERERESIIRNDIFVDRLPYTAVQMNFCFRAMEIGQSFRYSEVGDRSESMGSKIGFDREKGKTGTIFLQTSSLVSTSFRLVIHYRWWPER